MVALGPDLHPRQRHRQGRVQARLRRARARVHSARHQPAGGGRARRPDGAYDFGLGAGFYVDATEAPWSAAYRMWSYVADELPALVAAEFPVDASRQAITGHSMGGHGALTLGLSRPGRYRSVSAFAPICAPGQVPWERKALGGYLGPDPAAWRRHDAVALIEDGARALRSWSTRATPTRSWRRSFGPTCCRRRAPRRRSTSPCGCSRATTTATPSSPPSWPTTSPGMRSGWGERLRRADRRRRPRRSADGAGAAQVRLLGVDRSAGRGARAALRAAAALQ